MNYSALVTSLIISIIFFIVTARVTMALSNLAQRSARVWCTWAATFAIFSIGYWAMRLAGAPNFEAMDQFVRTSIALFVSFALWESSYLVRLWEKTRKENGQDIINMLKNTDLIANYTRKSTDELNKQE